jgi:hypothetical protein
VHQEAVKIIGLDDANEGKKEIWVIHSRLLG